MSETIIDDILLNDDNDEDLDYDLDPTEEHALLEEESDILDQDYEEDVLDLNEDYDQMEVNDDKSIGKSDNESKVPVNNENKNNLQSSTNQKGSSLKKIVRGVRRGINRNRNLYSARRSKTVLINPRFKGSVHVNSNQFGWDSTPCMNNYEPQRNHQFIQPWVTGNVQNHFPPPVNAYPPSPFVPPNQGTFLPPQINTNYIPPLQSISPFLQPPPVTNQHLLLNQPVMQLNPCPNQFHFQGPPQVPIIQQFPPEQQKLPVHQRLGVPSNSSQPNVVMQTPNNQPHFNCNQNLQTNNNLIIPQNFNQNQMPNSQHNNFQNNRPEQFQHSNFKSFNSNQQFRKNGNNFKNNKVVSVRKNSFNNERDVATEKVEVKKDVQEVKEEKKDYVEKIAEDEDEETREYRKKIEEQKRKREEILRKKEESRRKSLALETPQIVTKPNNRPFQQKKFNFPHNQHLQQNKQHKIQNYTNNIIITGNDHHQFGQRYNSLVPINNNIGEANRIVVPDNIQSSDNEVKSEDISSFLSTRSVITQENLSQTNIVVIKNLALATNESKIMKLCRDIGQVQKLQMEKNEHQATIHFNTVASAHAFYNKFRRRMIDLSMVQVDLVPFDSP